jgi:tripartite-type tricarboxylate transporter receptor subunit TctC
LQHIKAGKLRALATSGAERSDFLPDAPTIGSAGVAGYSTVQWHGMLAPAGTPQRLTDFVHAALKEILASEEGKRRLVVAGAEIDYLPSVEFGRFIRKDLEQWSQLVAKAGIKTHE